MFIRFFYLQAGLSLVGIIWMALAGYAFLKEANPLRDALAFGLLLAGVTGIEGLLGRLFPSSFQAYQSLYSQIGQIMRSEGMSYHQALLLALASGLGEELLFRGAVQNALFGGWIGLGAQALVFAALHPVPDRKAWVYPFAVFLIGLMFGLSYHLTGSLIPGILVHYINNARSFYALLDQKPQAM